MTITLSDLTFSYPGNEVLSDVSFEIKEGEFIGIIGPNGGGKTTLLHLMMGFLKPVSGKILLDGLPPKKRRKEMAFVPQSFQFDRQFPISTLEVVLTGRLSVSTYFGRWREKDKKTALEMLEKVGLASYAKSPFSELSGGQAKRALIARALVSHPHYLFLDEAFANIDPSTQEVICQLLLELKGEITILLVTHDLKEVLHHVDRLFLVEKTLSSLSPSEVCDHFAMGLYHPPSPNLPKKGV